jgi:hypothetical protein
MRLVKPGKKDKNKAPMMRYCLPAGTFITVCGVAQPSPYTAWATCRSPRRALSCIRRRVASALYVPEGAVIIFCDDLCVYGLARGPSARKGDQDETDSERQ